MAARKKSARKASARSQGKAQREFVAEAEEILERLRDDLADFQDQRAATGDVDPELINGIFRSAHSLKGLAGMFGVDGVADLAHHLEDILDGLRLGRMALDAPAVDMLDEAVALFTVLLGNAGDAALEEEGAATVADMVRRIESALSAPSPAESNEFQGLSLDPGLLRALTEYEEHRLRENLRRGRHLALVDTVFEIIAFEDGLAEISGAVKEVGEVVSTLPSPGDAPESQIRFSLLVATDCTPAELAERLDFPETSVEPVGGGSPGAPPELAERPAAPAVEPALLDEEIPPDEVSSARLDPGDIESLRSISDTVRVDIRKLDELMNLVGELVIQRSSISQIATRLGAESSTARLGAELTKVHKLLDRKLKELQAGVLDVRMVPLRQVFEKLSRVVRRLRRDTEKDVELEFKGADTELDKLIVEQLIDPLMHVVRNAFDHAIDSPEERAQLGKAPRATIHVEASQRGNHVVIDVTDDGRGMDPDRIRAVAEERGLVSPEDALTHKETLNLVFAPGFSTRTEVSETSGRGVGMDVVRSNLTAMGGVVDIQSTLGHGTTVSLTLPITLAIIQALIVEVDGQRFAIPLNSVLETLLVDPASVQRSEGRELLNLRGEALPLRRLSDEFGLQRAAEGANQYVVVLGLGELRMGLLVDRLEGQQDTVIKPIKGPVREIPGIAGATELGDQGAILVIDVSSIVEEWARRKEAA